MDADQRAARADRWPVVLLVVFMAAVIATLLLVSRVDAPALPGQSADPTSPGAEATDPPPVVLVGAGDIATCSGEGDESTAALLDEIEGIVFTTGDHAYPDGTADEFAACYGPSWGRHKDRTRPSPGNHDYHVRDASGYYGYFGADAGGPGGYYAYDAGTWRVYSLNSEIASDDQLAWLEFDLAEHPRACILAYWHHPVFSSGRHGNDKVMRPIWRALESVGADLILNGHDHDYERFAPQTASGEASADGIRQIVVGTGGAGLRPFDKVKPNSEVRNDDTHGVLELELSEDGYEWEFVPVAGGTFTDSGSDSCR